MANTLNLLRQGAVGSIDWLDGFADDGGKHGSYQLFPRPNKKQDANPNGKSARKISHSLAIWRLEICIHCVLMNAYAFVKRILSFSRVYKRFELFGIGADRLEFGQHLCDIALSQIPVVIMSAPTDGDVCKVRRDHDSNLDAITRFASEML